MPEQLEVRRGYKAKTIKAVLRKKINSWLKSIDDESVRKLCEKNTIVTGGCLASMLLGEPINDFDLYFTDLETTEAIARYYVSKFNTSCSHDLAVQVQDGRVKVTTPDGRRGDTAGNIEEITDRGEIDETYEATEKLALDTEDEREPKYRPVFMSTNAITLTNKIQIVLRFYGDADKIHENYDFVHCTNYWTAKDDELVLRPAALESLLSRELRYVGSKYPLCSIIRLRKFIKRGWVINAGQILKMAMQLNELELTDINVLEDQLTGVDSAYFLQVITALKEKSPEKVNTAYLVEIINRMF